MVGSRGKLKKETILEGSFGGLAYIPSELVGGQKLQCCLGYPFLGTYPIPRFRGTVQGNPKGNHAKSFLVWHVPNLPLGMEKENKVLPVSLNSPTQTSSFSTPFSLGDQPPTWASAWRVIKWSPGRGKFGTVRLSRGPSLGHCEAQSTPASGNEGKSFKKKTCHTCVASTAQARKGGLNSQPLIRGWRAGPLRDRKSFILSGLDRACETYPVSGG